MLAGQSLHLGGGGGGLNSFLLLAKSVWVRSEKLVFGRAQLRSCTPNAFEVARIKKRVHVWMKVHVCERDKKQLMWLETLENSPDHLELLIHFSCDHRSSRVAMNAGTRPVEQPFMFMIVDVCDRYKDDAGLCGQRSGFGWRVDGGWEIFLHHGMFTSNRWWLFQIMSSCLY